MSQPAPSSLLISRQGVAGAEKDEETIPKEERKPSWKDRIKE